MPKNVKLNSKEKLIAAAIDNMWQKNFGPTGVDQLCIAAGVTKGSFYYSFTSKNELGIAAINRLWHDTEEQIFIPIFNSDTCSWDKKFEQLVDKMKEMQAFCDFNSGSVLGCPFGNLGQEMAVQDVAIRRALEKIFSEQKHYFEKTLAAGEATGEIPKGDCKGKAESILALIQGANLMARINNDCAIFRYLANNIVAIATLGGPSPLL